MGIYSAVKSLFTKKQIESITQNVTDKTANDEILKIINKWKWSQSTKVTTAITTDGERNYSYYLGKYPRDLYALKYGKSQIVVNHIFASIKSVTPYVTSKPAEPVIYPRKYEIEEEKTEESKKIALYAQEIIKKIYKDSEVQALNEANTVNRYLYKIGILRYGVQDQKIFTRLVDPKDIYFDCSAKCFSDMKYIGEKIDVQIDTLIDRFPKHKDYLLRKTQWKTETRVQIVEWWTHDVVITTQENEILEVKRNPLLSEDEKLRYYEYAPLPFVALNVYNTGKSIVDDVSEIDLTYKIQDSLNDLYRQIIDNAKYNGNPIKKAIGLTADQLSQINSIEPGDSVVLPSGWDGVDVDFWYVQASPLPQYIVNMTQTLENNIDTIFWTQATFRGEFEGVQSWVSREILRDQAGNSLAQLSRGIERMMDNLYKGWLHIILTYADDPEFVKAQIFPILGSSTDEFIELLLNNEDGIEVTVQAWTILPDDKVTMAEQAMELSKMGKATTEFLYERLGIPNPKEEAEKFDLNATEIALKAQKLQQEQAMKESEKVAWQSEVEAITKEIESLE